MQGFHIQIQTDDDLTGILFNLYDNDELVIPNINTVDFDYLIQPGYSGDHELALTYHREDLPDLESERIVFYSGNFTLPALTLDVTAEVF